jgi:hypothetical protein
MTRARGSLPFASRRSIRVGTFRSLASSFMQSSRRSTSVLADGTRPDCVPPDAGGQSTSCPGA